MDKIYRKKSVAKGFDAEQKTIYGKIKSHWEIKSLLYFMPSLKNKKKKMRVLELGCGTGRITKALTDKGYDMTPTDISAEMLKVYHSNHPNLSKPRLVKTGKLPFGNNSFHTVVSMRVIWHITNKNERKEFFLEAARVAKRYVIMDFAIKGSGANDKFQHDHFFTNKEIRELSGKCNLRIDNMTWLPLGRKLIRFEKE